MVLSTLLHQASLVSRGALPTLTNTSSIMRIIPNSEVDTISVVTQVNGGRDHGASLPIGPSDGSTVMYQCVVSHLNSLLCGLKCSSETFSCALIKELSNR